MVVLITLTVKSVLRWIFWADPHECQRLTAVSL
jgi:hypothetical protein